MRLSMYMNYLKYLSIPYKHLGRDFSGTDCFGLVALFYLEEFVIALPEFTNYVEDWHKSNPTLIYRRYREAGFYQVTSFETGDILLIQETGKYKHLGIVVPGGYFLHTLHNGTFCHSYAQGEYYNKVGRVFRYKF